MRATMLLILGAVILNEVKNLLISIALCALPIVLCEEMLRVAQHDIIKVKLRTYE